MPKRCVAGRCSRITQDNVSVHKWPKDSTVRDKWDRFVRLTRKWDKGHGESYLCQKHFKDEDFINFKQWQAGFSKHLLLHKSAVPTIKYVPDDEGVTVLTANQLTGDDGQGCSGAQSTDRATDSPSSSVKRASITSPTTSYKKPRKSRAMDKINIARVSC